MCGSSEISERKTLVESKIKQKNELQESGKIRRVMSARSWGLEPAFQAIGRKLTEKCKVLGFKGLESTF
jgi:hypothetical protein